MFVAAVTGTNGKTSTVELTRQILEQAGLRACSYGTLGLCHLEGRQASAQMGIGKAAARHFVESRAFEGFEALVLEAYSRPLQAGLLDCLDLNAAAFTSFGRDHLDLHGTREAYFKAKERLFTDVLPPGRVAVLNADIPESARLQAVCRARGIDAMTFGRAANADLRLIELRHIGWKAEVLLSIAGYRFPCRLALSGGFMIHNALCAAGLALASGVAAERIEAVLPKLQPPAGRFEWVACHRGADVFVDYAHTPDALTALLSALRPRTVGSLVLVFGCGGNRDRGKRRPMGEIAGELADQVIVTDDNPRDEDPAAIRQEIIRACPSGREIEGRRQAITEGLSSLSEGDVLVIAGKGHETNQITRRKEEKPFSDREVVSELVALGH